MKLRVNEDTQINHGGKTYGPGETFDAAEEQAREYIAAGWATAVARRGRKG